LIPEALQQILELRSSKKAKRFMEASGQPMHFFEARVFDEPPLK
jgi:hypothetical protein